MISQRIVVLGGTGFVGRRLLRRLAVDGHDLLLLSRNLGAHLDRLLPPDVNVRQMDVYDEAALRAAFADADAVVNLVGILNEHGDDGSGFRRAHVDLTRTIIAACQAAGVRRLLQMSALNAGRGSSHYLASRGEAEALVRASGLEWTIFEPSVIFGDGDGFFFRFAALLRQLPVLPLARPNAKFAPVFVGDVAEAYARALDDPSTIGETYELYGQEIVTLRQAVEMTARQLGLRRWVIPLPDWIGRLQALACDFVPGKPFSSDNFRSLLTDAVGGIDGLHRLGIEPVSMSRTLPSLLGHAGDVESRRARYRAKR
jgi:uncharacterized protein YbjT (DUF2867 family)